jgi:hypothetical protein
MIRTPSSPIAHPQFRLERHTQLSDHDDVQRRLQRSGDLKGDRNTTPRKTDHDHVLTPQMPQPSGQAPSRIDTINKDHGCLLAPRPQAPLA